MLNISIFLLFLSIISVSQTQKEEKDWTKLSLSTGAIRGRKVVTSKNATAYLFHGIPFAEPPIGDLRFRELIDKKKWEGELDATEYQAACMSARRDGNILPKSGKMSEDCLHMNVFTTEKCLTEKNCPVVYCIFGGQWYFNSPFTLNTESLIENFNLKDIVFITFNYRLASFGFINTGKRSSAIKNLGILDMIHGLRWTQREIGNFGGDKNKVTIMGHSSGGEAADMIAMSPKTDGLFNQVILQSGPAGMHDLREDKNLAVTRALAVNIGCATEDLWDASDSPLETIITCLRNKPAEELLREQKRLEDKGELFFGPANDGPDGVLPEPINALQRKRRPYRILLGTTSREFRKTKYMLNTDGTVNRPLLYAACVQYAKNQGFKHSVVVGRACADDYSKRPFDVPDLDDDPYIYLPTYYSGEAMRRKGAAVYKYSFEYKKIGTAFANAQKEQELESPFHAEDLVYVTGVTKGTFTAKDEKISQIYSGMFADFIKTGDPSPPYHEKWQPTDDRNNYFKIDFDDNMNMPGNTNGYHASAVRFWTKTAPEVDQSFSKWDVNGTFDLKKFAQDLIQGLKEMGTNVSQKIEEEIEKWKDDLRGSNEEGVERLEQILDDLLDRIQNGGAKNKHDHKDDNDQIRSALKQMAPQILPSVRDETTVVDSNWKMWFWVATGVSVLLAVMLFLTCCSACYQHSKRRRYERLSETTGLCPSSVKTYG